LQKERQEETKIGRKKPNKDGTKNTSEKIKRNKVTNKGAELNKRDKILERITENRCEQNREQLQTNI
jgi:hypothetical protein